MHLSLPQFLQLKIADWSLIGTFHVFTDVIFLPGVFQ